jgi:hypothetical protein
MRYKEHGILKMATYKVCKGILFNTLPSEEENAFSHHSNLKILEKSIKKYTFYEERGYLTTSNSELN